MIVRTLQPKLQNLATRFPVVTVTGPRQSGKTTLSRMAFPKHSYVSLEAPDLRRWACEDPRGFLEAHSGGVILDEIQRAPELTSYIQVAVDADPAPGRYVLTGSYNLALMDLVSQSLAGRTAVVHLLPFDLEEVRRQSGEPEDLLHALWAGGYPAIHERSLPPEEWLGSYAATYVQRDVRQLVNVTDLVTFETFLSLCAGRAAQLTNLSALGADAGVSHNTARAWLSVLETSFILFRLPPLHRNIRKRLVKTPKLYLHDTGLACWLLGIREPGQLERHPLRGAIFENWVVSEILKSFHHRGLEPRASFYRDHRGDEVDLVLDHATKLMAVECKSGRTLGADFFDALDRFEKAVVDIPVERYLVYGGDEPRAVAGRRAVPWRSVSETRWWALG